MTLTIHTLAYFSSRNNNEAHKEDRKIEKKERKELKREGEKKEMKIGKGMCVKDVSNIVLELI